MFKANRQNDAWGTIRGFVYQVEITIQRWLSLKSEEILELERGEDIDLSGRALVGDSDAIRTLEQVKYRASHITLGQPEALEVLLNAVEHLGNNPELALRFQYTTNARAGRERSSPMPGKLPAIEAWEQLRSGTITGDKAAAVIEGLRSILLARTRPKKCSLEVWEYFFELFSSPDEKILEFVGRFSWLIAQPSITKLQPKIEAQLINDGHAPDQSAATQIYQRLFVFVFKMLTRPGVKHLTAELLHSTMGEQLSEPDSDILAQINAQLLKFQRQIEEVTARTELLESTVRVLTEQQGVTAAVQLSLGSPSLDVPYISPLMVNRSSVIAEFEAKLSEHTCLFVYGLPGAGKTEIAKQLGSSRPREAVFWIEFRDLDFHEASYKLDSAASLAARVTGDNRFEAYQSFCYQLEKPGLIILDDVPDLSCAGEFRTRFELLARACKQTGANILLTGHRAPAAGMSQWVDSPLGDSTAVPPFNEREVYDLLCRATHGKANISGNFAKLVHVATGGDPSLVYACARFMSRNPQTNEDQFLAVLTSKYAEDLKPATSRQLQALIPNFASRDLLYRLNCVLGKFDDKVVATLAAVSPPVTMPKEHLADLLDICIIKDPEGWIVSPRFRMLGSDNLLPSTKDDCHVALACSILRNKCIDQHQGEQAIVHFAAAKRYASAGSVLVQLLMEVNKLDDVDAEALMPRLWADMPLPDEMPIDLKLIIRALQIQISIFKDSITMLLDDFDKLLCESDPSSPAHIISKVMVGRVAANISVERAAEYLGSALPAMKGLGRQLLPESKLRDPNLQPEMLMWAVAMQVSTPAELQTWLNTVASLPREQIQVMFSGTIAEYGCAKLGDSMRPKPSESHDNADLMRRLAAMRELEAWAVERELEFLSACAVKGQMVLNTEYLNEISQSEVLAAQFLSNDKSDIRAVIEVKDYLATHFNITGDYGRALPLFLEMQSLTVESLPTLRVYSHLRACEAALALGKNLHAQHQASAAVHLASFEPDAAHILPIALHCRAITHWNLSRVHDAVWDFYEVFTSLESKHYDLFSDKVIAVIMHYSCSRLFRYSYCNWDSGNNSLPDEEALDIVKAVIVTSESRATEFSAAMREGLRAMLAVLLFRCGRGRTSNELTSRIELDSLTDLAKHTVFGFFARELTGCFAMTHAPTKAARTALLAAEESELKRKQRTIIEGSLYEQNPENIALASLIGPVSIVLSVCDEYIKQSAGWREALDSAYAAIRNNEPEGAGVFSWRPYLGMFEVLGTPRAHLLPSLLGTKQNFQKNPVTYSMAELVSSFNDFEDPRVIIGKQIQACVALDHCWNLLGGAVFQQLTKVICVFWQQYASRYRVLLSPPDFWIKRIHHAATDSDATRLANMLLTLVQAFGLRITDEQSSYLRAMPCK